MLALLVAAAAGCWLAAAVSAVQAVQRRRAGTGLLQFLLTSRVLTRPDLFEPSAAPYLRRFQIAFAGFFLVLFLAIPMGLLFR